MSEQTSSKLGANSHDFSAFGGFSPLGHVPLSASKLRRFGSERAKEGFLAALLENLIARLDGGAPRPGELYPWLAAPVLLAVSGSEVLVDSGGEPLDLATAFSLNRSAIADYASSPQRQAHLLYLGEFEAEQTYPVLALTGGWETFVEPGQNLVLVGPDGEPLEIRDWLAARTGGAWEQVRSYAELGFDDGAQTASARQWGELLAAAVALNFWHASHSFDPASGAQTRVIQAGWARKTESGRELFPRTDPAVITAVTAEIDGVEKIALGQARAWAKNRYSTFAGFVEVGESLENAVAREVAEECKGRVESMEYLGSQPWPFPRSLMFGFRARVSNPGEVCADGEEIETVRWFSRQELLDVHESGEVVLPGRSSISRKLIENFYGGPLLAASEQF